MGQGYRTQNPYAQAGMELVMSGPKRSAMSLSVGLCCPWHAGQQGLKPIWLLSWHKEMTHVWVCGSGREGKYWNYTSAIAASSSHNGLG